MSNQTLAELGNESTHTIIEPSALEAQERAQTDVQITTAKRYPRSLSVVKKKMLDFATLDQETAEACFYTLSRQGKTIQGPSARLAEIAASAYGNLKAGARIVGNDGKTVTAQAVCHDLENNVCIAVETKRRITDKYGKTYSDDMQVVTGNAACSIALRNALFKVIPSALIKPVYESAKRVAVGDAKTLSSRRSKAMETFAKMGVPEARVLATLNRAGVDDVTLEDLEKLIGLLTALREGDTTIDEAFPTSAAASAKPVFAAPTPPPAAAPAPEAPVDAAPTAKPEAAAVPQEAPANDAPQPLDERGELIEQVRRQLDENDIDQARFNEWLRDKRHVILDGTLTEVPTAKLRQFLGKWPTILMQLRGEAPVAE